LKSEFGLRWVLIFFIPQKIINKWELYFRRHFSLQH